MLAANPRLDLGADPIGGVGLRALAEARLGAPRELWFRDDPIVAVKLAALAGAPHLGRIERLHVGGGALSPGAIRPLVRAPWLSSSQRLVLDSGDAREGEGRGCAN